ncbi:AAA family ATPase [Phycicoccus sonneratiae]|uniref:Nuclease SbcCD subunit C n=1 Tax=Phycicoccus sonneratiae TaxID=2807628 RepID=A0ABS2CIJ8_9MICO|nr:SMC family ATPase [Phycicoccus sonneraticus]MBM6399687.1 SMC family ATPase [Phycicoccus sonneraticus]
MRIHRLEVEAFGPFAGRVVLDVDEVSAAGLFLVHGPTGSGKTSLLDAVCFALYADVPGARRKQALRSDHAAPDAVPQVVLEVTVAGRRLRITRSPEWHRPKKRGDGTTRVQPAVVLEERLGGAWTALSTRHDEVADVVLDVLGMGLKQFASVVMLPQGDFAAFLRATPEERREILERLFDIGVYSDVEQWLADARRDGAAGLDDALLALRADLVRLDDVLGALRPDGADDPDGATLAGTALDALPARLAEVADGLTDRVTASLAALDAAESLEALATQRLAGAQEVLGHRRRGEQARARLAALDAAADEHAERVRTLDAADRAAGVRGHLTALDRLRAEADARTADLDAQHDAVAALGVDLAGTDAGDAAERARSLDDVVAALARDTGTARELATGLAEGTRRRDGLVARDAALADEVPVLRAAVEAAEATVTRLSGDGARVAPLAAAVEEQEARLALHDGVDADRRRVEALQPTLAEARTAVSEALAALIALQQRRLDEMAAELATGLADGAPCPVCGSAEHPAPAVAVDPVTPEQLAVAEQAVAGARAASAAVEGEVTALEAAVGTRLDVLGGATRADVETALEQARAEHADAVTAAASLATGTAELRVRRSALERLTAEQDRLAATLEALDERLAEVATEAEATTVRLADDLAQHAGCPCGGGADTRRHARVVTALTELATASASVSDARARLDAASEDLAAALSDTGFATAREAAEALLGVADTDRLRDAVLGHERDRTAAAAALTEPEVLEALAGDAPDVDALRLAAAEARRTVLAAGTEHDALGRATRTLERLRPGLEAACAAVADRAARQARVRELADTVGGTGGDNTLRMRLTSFVLAARLEKVAALANERLAVMGGGRYLLEHSDDRAARGARSGLGLRVLDQWTGRSRDTASLSGGESFMASLALALGLADAVREEAGGLDLGTLFIDEGFGSLDDDSLEQVLTVLDGLREGGRAVGVVSHVADLRARIPHQVVVTKGADGSGATVRAAGAAPAA